MNEQLANQVIQQAINLGITEYCICPGARNSAFFTILMQNPHLKKYFWFEERSAAFFALGKSRSLGQPVAVITTSGTAAGELLPAAMEAFYTGVPLLLITADRPRRFRGTGAPQAAEQVGLFGLYTPFAQDMAAEDQCRLGEWSKHSPAHLNVCFEDPFRRSQTVALKLNREIDCNPTTQLDRFLKNIQNPLVVVSSLKSEARQPIIDFLIRLNAPVFLEGVSGLRENPLLRHLRVTLTDNIWESAAQADYPIDGVLRIGGIPTFGLWRDLEDLNIQVCSVSDLPFAGLSRGNVIDTTALFQRYTPTRTFSAKKWLSVNRAFYSRLQTLFQQEPTAEPSLFWALSQRIPKQSHIYLGNSLPIREWDLAANEEERNFHVTASRGLNGIDGQISTFLGLSTPGSGNWAILGDLTTLYDLAGPWIIPQIPDTNFTLVIINNGGGKIFSKLSLSREFQNEHTISFKPFAALWNLPYKRWTSIPSTINTKQSQVIEIIPDGDATERLRHKIAGNR